MSNSKSEDAQALLQQEYDHISAIVSKLESRVESETDPAKKNRMAAHLEEWTERQCDRASDIGKFEAEQNLPRSIEMQNDARSFAVRSPDNEDLFEV